jgi:hypothetical protein
MSTAWFVHFITPKLIGHEQEFEISHSGVYYFLLVLTFLPVVAFNLAEAGELFSMGYSAIILGELGLQKGMVIFIFEMAFIVLTAIGLSTRSTIAVILFVVYSITLTLGGQRMPGLMCLLVVFVLWKPAIFSGRWLSVLSIPAFILVIPLVMSLQTLRAYGEDWLEFVDISLYYSDFFNVIAHSYDTLKLQFIDGISFDFDVNPFAKFAHVLNVFFERILGIELALNSNGFAKQATIAVDPDIYFERNSTVASSGVAESFYFFGFLGPAIYALIVAAVFLFVAKSTQVRSPLLLTIVLIFLPKFFVGIRNELFGWFYEGLIHFVIAGLIYFSITRMLKPTVIQNSGAV